MTAYEKFVREFPQEEIKDLALVWNKAIKRLAEVVAWLAKEYSRGEIVRRVLDEVVT